MSIFKQLDLSIENIKRRITINKMDCALDHFGEEEKIVEFLDEIGTIKGDQEKSEKDFLIHLHNYLKTSQRVELVEFYRGKLALVVLVVSNRAGFDKVPLYKRNMTIEGKSPKFIVSIVEVLKSEYSDIESGKRKLPKSWKFDEGLTKSYNRLRVLSL